MTKLQGAAAAVTGAASGIGRALAGALAERGCSLALADRDQAGLDAVAAPLAAKPGITVTTHRLDVSDATAVAAFAATAAASHPGLNIIVNNAGVALMGDHDEVELADMQWLMNINFWGVVYGTKAFLPHLEAAGEGHIVNLSSVFGLISVPSQSAYNAAKFAVRGFTDALRMELEIAGSPVSCTTIHPGGIKTNIARNARVSDDMMDLAGEDEGAALFEKAAMTSPEKAARQILLAVTTDRRRALIGPDAKVIDLISRLPIALYEELLVKGVRKARKDRGASPAPTTPST